ncbi:EAL domain-containing protein [Sulfuriferula plumbiphila]|uniref:EAL domain-containing protein n=1 Tax=Sulfuriferula plumbiphila TaxID=171865 RepID=UPI00135D0908|nr:EAL domain-containing protein [Sulfuriferula plumbiphila]BBP03013.1 GGDEF domain-containing protein [Sulfuriferula plumbiphila]
MKSLDETVEAVMRTLGLDDAAVVRRKAFLEFTDDDVARLRTLHAALQDLAPDFVDAFYTHLLAFEETRALLPHAQTLERLKRTQAAYFDNLTAGDYGPDYILHRLRVGAAHQRAGLAPAWYLGGYSKYLAGLFPELWQRLGKDPEAFVATCQALIKIVLLDMGLAIDTYIQADRQTILTLKEYADIVFASIPDGLLVLSPDLTVLSANRAFLERLGLTEEAVRGRYLMEVLAADGLRGRALEVLATGVAQHDVLFSMGPAGSDERKPVRVTLTGIRLAEEEEEEEARLLLIVEDLTEEQALRAAALESERRFRDLAETAHDGIIMTDPQGKIAYFNRAAERMFGYRRNQALQRSIGTVLPEPLSCQLDEGLQHTPVWETQGRRQDGTFFMVEGSSSVFEGSAGRFITYVLRDLTERKQFERQLIHLANHDPLTHLPNRKFFQDRLGISLDEAALNEEQLAVLFLDLDRFKLINDTFGHALGDKLLLMVAERLAGCFRKGDMLARLGGDEFVVLLRGLSGKQDATLVAQKIMDGFAHAFQLEAHEAFVSASIGIAFYPSDAIDADNLIRCADSAMYQAKEQGLGYQFYRLDLENLSSERLTLENSLRRALERDELRLYYQPKVDLASGAVIGLEALLRWAHPVRGMIPPDQFVPLAEETGLIVPIGEWVLRTACLQIKAWQGEGMPLLPVAVNLSARQFRQPSASGETEGRPLSDEAAGVHDLVETIERVLGETGVDPSCLELEITESILMQNLSTAANILQALSAKGMRIFIDDFGTGYSSLSYLKRLPIDTIKIDKSFVGDITTDQDDAAIVAAIIAMAHSLRLKVVAEGVETQEQFDFLLERGCDAMQGYFYSKPLPAEEILPLLRSTRNSSSGRD